MEEKIGYAASGGSTKIAGILGAARASYDGGFRPNLLAGVSSGSISLLPVALGLWDEAVELSLNVKLSDFFDIVPVNDKGKLTKLSVFRILRNLLGSPKTYSIGVQNVPRVLKRVITKGMWDDFVSSDKEAFAMAVNRRTKARKHFRLKDFDYETALLCIAASSAIPVFTQAIYVAGAYWYDGGIRDHNPSAFLLRNFDLKELVSVYSRPEIAEPSYTSVMPSKIIEEFNIAYETLTFEISKSDEAIEDLICESKGVKQTKLFLPNILKSLYDTDSDRLKQLYSESYNNAISKFDGYET